jgi:hypothetical protein
MLRSACAGPLSSCRARHPPEAMLNILIVESAAKARPWAATSIPDWKVVATGGHVQTLPHDRSAHGKDAKKAYWANRPDELPNPPWVWTDRGEKALESILEHAEGDATFWIATDPDREGEFIAWCLERLLRAPRPDPPGHLPGGDRGGRARGDRAPPRKDDSRMVESALLRKFLDRLVGYRTSKLARAVIPGGSASMGRVQTPTLGFVVDRELEREAHVPSPTSRSGPGPGVDLQVRFHEPDDDDVWKNEAGGPSPPAPSTKSWPRPGPRRRSGGRPGGGDRGQAGPELLPEPFSTDALLQAAGSRFGWSPKKTSALASMLYEAGHITYIRTDSTRLAESAVVRPPAVIEEAFGEDHLASGGRPPAPSGPAGPVQDAHEAIRPTRLEEEDVALVDDADAAEALPADPGPHPGQPQMAPSATSPRGSSPGGGTRPAPHRERLLADLPGMGGGVPEFRDEPATSPPDAPSRWGRPGPSIPGGGAPEPRARRGRDPAPSALPAPHPHQGHEGRGDRPALHLLPDGGEARGAGATWRGGGRAGAHRAGTGGLAPGGAPLHPGGVEDGALQPRVHRPHGAASRRGGPESG